MIGMANASGTVPWAQSAKFCGVMPCSKDLSMQCHLGSKEAVGEMMLQAYEAFLIEVALGSDYMEMY